MFSGIVENVGVLEKMIWDQDNLLLTFRSGISKEAYIDQSIAHNGVCLTVVSYDENSHTVVAIQETLEKTNLSSLKIGDKVNLERSITAQSRMDGHFVQGHVDKTASCSKIEKLNGSWLFHFTMLESDTINIVDKGSICINGVSLTVVKVDKGNFHVAIIPYTFENTNFSLLRVGDLVNIEFDILGKYILNYLKNIDLRTLKQ